MKKGTTVSLDPQASSRDVLTEILNEGAQRLLAAALDAEVEAHIQRFERARDEHGHRLVVRNGYLPERTIQTGVGAVRVSQPRVEDRRPSDEREPFTSRLLPPYLRRTKSVDDLIPWLYLKGISTQDFPEALTSRTGLVALRPNPFGRRAIQRRLPVGAIKPSAKRPSSARRTARSQTLYCMASLRCGGMVCPSGQAPAVICVRRWPSLVSRQHACRILR